MSEASRPARVLGVLAGADMPLEQLKRWVESADVVFAADGGANRLHEIGFIPDAVVGDLDSISAEVEVVQKELVRDGDQNSTDCDKLLAFALAQGHGQITLAGVEGDLLDHSLGAIQSAARSELDVRLALRRGLGWIAKGSCEVRLSTTRGKRLSVIPLDACAGVTLTGTRWPLENALLDPNGLTSLSNIAEQDEVTLQMVWGQAFVFVETDGNPTWSDG